MRDNKVQSVTRAIGLLKIITSFPNGIGVSELARTADLHKSTVSRLIATLEAAGAVSRTPTAEIQIKPAFSQLFVQQASPNTLIAIAQPFLQELSLKFGEASSLALPDEHQTLYTQQISPDTTIQVRDWTGYRFPLHTVSAGKLILAYKSAAEIEQYLAWPLAAYTENTITDPEQLKESLAEIRRTGISWINNEFADGLSGVATPIYNHKQQVVAALSMYGPSYRFPSSDTFDNISKVMISYAEQCSAQLQKLNP